MIEEKRGILQVAMSTLIPNNDSDDIIKSLEMERKLGEFVYNYLIRAQSQVSEAVKKLLQRFKPKEYGHNGFFINVGNIDLSTQESYSDTIKNPFESGAKKLIIDVMYDVPHLHVNYRDELNSKVYEQAKQILNGSLSGSSTKAEQMRDVLCSTRWALQDIPCLATLYNDLLEREGGTLNIVFLDNNNQMIDNKCGTRLKMEAACAGELNSLVIECLLSILNPNIATTFYTTEPDDDSVSVICNIRK